MIHRVAFDNFYSFKDRVDIDLRVSKRAPDTDAYFQSADTRVTKLMTVVGANASGKTNLLKSVVFLDYFICSSFQHQPGEELYFKQFTTSEDNTPSNFEIVFETEGSVYEYVLQLTTKKVLFEKLRVKDKKFKMLYKRNWNDESAEYDYDFRKFDVSSDFKKLIKENASVISTGYHANHKQSRQIVEYFASVHSNLYEEGKIGREPESEVLKFYMSNAAIKRQAEDILARFDTGLQEIVIEKSQNADTPTRFTAFAKHKIGAEKTMNLPLSYESSGTRNLLALLKTVLVVLEVGGVAILDEMDSDLHPYIVSEVVKLFESRTSNPHNAQLIFSIHSVHVLNRLDKFQITLVEKIDGHSVAYQLNNLDVRADDNYYAKYMAGAYGAVPRT